MQRYAPEGAGTPVPTPEVLRQSVGTGSIYQAMCVKCDEFHNLHVDLGAIHGIIPRNEAALGIPEGVTREIAILSRVGKPVSFQILDMDRSGGALLSRRAAQEDAKQYYLSTLRAGDILAAVVQNPADFGVFCDIGCGLPALMRIDRCCVSRLRSGSDLFHTGQPVYAAVLSVDHLNSRINLTGRELLGTWAENAARFRCGQIVPGIVRSITSYGSFIELTPNLSGLAEPDPALRIGDRVSVFIRAIQPEKHKIKLTVLEKLYTQPPPPEMRYYLPGERLDFWEYYPGSRAVTSF